jgi:hypothetical protein
LGFGQDAFWVWPRRGLGRDRLFRILPGCSRLGRAVPEEGPRAPFALRHARRARPRALSPLFVSPSFRRLGGMCPCVSLSPAYFKEPPKPISQARPTLHVLGTRLWVWGLVPKVQHRPQVWRRMLLARERGVPLHQARPDAPVRCRGLQVPTATVTAARNRHRGSATPHQQKHRRKKPEP